MAMYSKAARRRRELLWAEQNGRCLYCDGDMIKSTAHLPKRERHPGTQATLDHKLPRSRGGTRGNGNLALACGNCNRRKGNLTHEEFLGIHARYIAERRLVNERERSERGTSLPPHQVERYILGLETKETPNG